tara:strand:- start:146 stop:445 length:300 start_codon:yes stop_codon:yes gene_type:complete
MDKFLDTPVTGETDMLISCADVIAVTIGDTGGTGSNPTTCTMLTYNSGNTVVLTHAAIDSTYQMRDSVQNAMEEALKTSWTDVAFAYVPAQAVSAVAVA